MLKRTFVIVDYRSSYNELDRKKRVSAITKGCEDVHLLELIYGNKILSNICDLPSDRFFKRLGFD